MSLRVWLPLTGDLRNNGLSDVTVTNNGATVDNSGKIGKCYSFGTASSYLTLPPSSMTAFQNECTLSFWVYITSWNTSYATIFQAGLGGNSWNNYVFGVLRVANSSKLCFTITDINGTTSSASYLTSDLSTSTWYHLTFVYKTGHCLIYINGVLFQDYTTTIVPKFSKISKITIGVSNIVASYQTNCKLNDFRIYDHALSPKEVKLLSQGLVCHYKLSDIVQPNLLKQELRSYTPINYEACRINFTENMVANETYTVQLWDVDVSHTGKTADNLSVSLWWGGGSNRIVTWSGTSYFINGHADYLTATFTVTEAQASASGSGNLWFNVYNSIPNAEGDKYLHIEKWKMEKGSVATPWTQSSADSYYSSENIVYDSSGYNHHGVNYSSQVLPNAPRNANATFFDGSSQYIEFPNLSFMPTMLPDEWSFSFWVYNQDNGDRSIIFSNYQLGTAGINGFCFEKAANNNLRVGYVGGKFDRTIPNSTMTVDAWTHYVVTKTKAHLVTVYRNGIQIDSYTNTNCASEGVIYRMGRDVRSDSTMYHGGLADFRAYATVLTLEDAQELYNAPVSIANTGTMLTQGEFVEVAT